MKKYLFMPVVAALALTACAKEAEAPVEDTMATDTVEPMQEPMTDGAMSEGVMGGDAATTDGTAATDGAMATGDAPADAMTQEAPATGETPPPAPR